MFMCCKKLRKTRFCQKPVGEEQMGTQALKCNTSGPKSYQNLGLVMEDKPCLSETPQVLSLLSSLLERTIHKNERSSKAVVGKDAVTIFHGSKAPALSIRQYIDRIFKYSSCSPSCFVVAYIYLEKFLQLRNAHLTSLNVHRLLITSIMLAAKFVDDECYNNGYYAKVGGVSTAEMNKLEMEFLSTIDFRLHVTVEVFNKYCLLMEEEATRKCQVGRPIQLCGLTGSLSIRDESHGAVKVAGYSCRAI